MKNTNQNLIITIDLLKDADSLIFILKPSLYLQKQFINSIEFKISSFLKNKGKNTNDVIALTEKLISVLPTIISQLGIPFVYYFFNQKNIFQSFLNLYYDQYNEKVSKIYKTCLSIFSFSKNFDKLEEIKHNLKDYGIIENNEEFNDKEIDMNPEQALFEEISLMLKKIPELKSIGNIKEILSEFENEYFDNIKKMKNLKNKMILNSNQLEFYQELIKPCEDFLKSVNNNFKNSKDEKFINIKNINDEKINVEDKEIILDLLLEKRTFFYMNEKIKEKPNKYIEFKNYQLPLDDKRNEIKDLLCGFLNAEGGRIYIGINDNSIVEGINLNYKKRDILRNDIINLTYDFYPKCRVDKVFVYFIPIKKFKTEKFIPKKYIIKIRIYPGDPEVLYSTMNKGGYFSTIRKDIKCEKLSSKQIYNEIILRNECRKIIKEDKNQILKENEIKDPEPEINKEDLENDEKDDDIPIFANNNLNNNKKKLEKAINS